MVAKKMTIEDLAKTIEGLAIMTQKGFDGLQSEFDGKFRSLKNELTDFKQETKGNFALVRQEMGDFKRDMRSEFNVLKLGVREDIERVAKMGREDMDAFGQDIVKLKKRQTTLENFVKATA